MVSIQVAQSIEILIYKTPIQTPWRHYISAVRFKPYFCELKLRFFITRKQKSLVFLLIYDEFLDQILTVNFLILDFLTFLLNFINFQGLSNFRELLGTD